MGEETPAKAHISFDQSHVNIKLPNRCRRCHTYNEDPDAPSLRESFVILLSKMMRSPRDVCFLLSLALPYVAYTGLSLLLFLFSGHYTLAMSLFHCWLILTIVWVGLLKYSGRQRTREYSTEQDLIALNSSGIIHS